MKKRIMDLYNQLFCRVPEAYAHDFKLDCLAKNVQRFAILPFFNIVIQISCIFIYLYVYPVTYPERKQVDPGFYFFYSFVYCIINLGAAVLFIYLRDPTRRRRHERLAMGAVLAYIMAYVVMEALQVAIELEISGNIYRFLATFFVVSFFPIVGRKSRFFYMGFYIAVSEVALYFLRHTGVSLYGYAEINLIVFAICLVATNIYHNSVVRNFELRRRLEFLSLNDELTGLANRRSLNQYLQQCWDSALRGGGDVGVLMIDIDYFKAFNDTYGHQAGDDCLVAVAGAIAGCFERSIDLTARYGGEEFVAVVLYMNEEGAMLLAERARAAVEALGIPHTGNVTCGVVTCSIGVAVERPRRGETPELLLRHADNALYRAKAGGRNRVEFYSLDDSGDSTAQ